MKRTAAAVALALTIGAGLYVQQAQRVEARGERICVLWYCIYIP